MAEVLVVGGRQAAAGAHSDGRVHDLALVVGVDLDGGSTETLLEYVSPPAVCPDTDASMLFKAATAAPGRLHLCTDTEILTYDYPSFRRTARLSLPQFNDLHHVLPTDDGNILVVNTGRDRVELLTPTGDTVHVWNMADGTTGQSAVDDVDWRKVPSTKPHTVHPNHAFVLDGEIWATRLVQRDAVCLTRPGLRMPIDAGPPHDGLVTGDAVYFTTVNGHVVVFDRATRRLRTTIDLAASPDSDIRHHVAWCRGLAVLDEDHVVVGLSRLRGTRWPEHLDWLKVRAAMQALLPLPPSLGVVDVRRRRLERLVDLAGAGLDAICSIHPAAALATSSSVPT